MKKNLVVILMVIGVVSLGLLFVGCGQSGTTTSTTSPTTTLSASASVGSSAAGTVSIVSGLSSTATNLGSLTSTKPSASSIHGLGAGSPPAAFFNAFPSNGKITFEGFVSGEVVEMQFFTKSGITIDADFLAARNIATLEGFNWSEMQSGFSFTNFGPGIYKWLTNSPSWEPGNTTKEAIFYNSATKYRALATFWDYIAWAHIVTHPSMEGSVDAAYLFYPAYKFSEGAINVPPPSRYPKTSTPEAQPTDKIGSQKAHVTGTHPNGDSVDLTQIISVDAQGKPVSSTGEGTVTRSDGAVMTIESVSTTFTDGSLTSADMDMIVGAPKNFHIILTMTSSGAASGEVFNRTSPETKKGNLVIFAVKDSSGKSGYFEDTAGNKEYF